MAKSPNSKVDNAASPSYGDDHIDITAAFSRLNLSQDISFPSKDQCIAHLKLLEAIYLLKEDVVSRDGLYGILESFVQDGATDNEAAKILKRLHEKKWQIFVCKAVERFQCWFKNRFRSGARMCTIDDMEKPTYVLVTKLARPLQPAANGLPPLGLSFVLYSRTRLTDLDVLMVWHSFILNPRTYLSDCIRFGLIDLWAGGIPWQTVDSVINNDTLAYEPNDDAKSQWVALTGSPWDPLEEPDTITIACPKCKRQHTEPWTTYTKSECFTSKSKDFQGRGYADAGLMFTCNCGLLINHDALRCFKFMTDLKYLTNYNVPMPGSFLNMHGMYINSS